MRSTSSADELQLIEEAVDGGEEGDEKKGSPETLTKTSSYVNQAFMKSGEGEELTPSPAVGKEDREVLYKSDPQQQQAGRVSSTSSKDKSKADSKKGKGKPSAKKQIKRPDQKQRASSFGAHGVPVLDPRLSRQQQQQIAILQQQQQRQMRALQQQQQQQRVQHSRASVPPEVLAAYERERRAARSGSKGAQGKRASAPPRTETAAAATTGENEGSRERDASICVAPTGTLSKRKVSRHHLHNYA